MKHQLGFLLILTVPIDLPTWNSPGGVMWALFFSSLDKKFPILEYLEIKVLNADSSLYFLFVDNFSYFVDPQ